MRHWLYWNIQAVVPHNDLFGLLPLCVCCSWGVFSAGGKVFVDFHLCSTMMLHLVYLLMFLCRTSVNCLMLNVKCSFWIYLIFTNYFNDVWSDIICEGLLWLMKLTVTYDDWSKFLKGCIQNSLGLVKFLFFFISMTLQNPGGIVPCEKVKQPNV